MSDFMGVDMDVPTEVFLLERYKSIIAGSDLPQSIKDMLTDRDPETMDELDEAYAELIDILQQKNFYITLARIEKGERMLAEETDEGKKAKYRAGLNKLAIELESYRPKEDAM